jgi:Flp pilus assembly protein TadG
MASTFFGRSRRGIALVLMVMMMSIFVLAAAFSADFGRMYLIRAQLQAAADAAAMAAVNALGNSVGATSRDSGLKFIHIHSAAGIDSLKTAIADVQSGSWVKIGGVWTWVIDPDQGWAKDVTTAGNVRDAVRVVVRDTAQFTFGRILGWNKRVLSAEAIGVWGSVSSSSCVRPWAIPYQQLLDQLYPPAGTKDPSYNMTTADIARLSTMTYATNPVSLKVSNNNTYTANGQFYAIDIPPGEYADGTAPANKLTGASNYRAEEAAVTCAELAQFYAANGVDGTVSLGDWLNPETGNMQGPTEQGIGGQGQNPGLCGTSDTCSPEIKIAAAFWDTYGDAPGGHCSSCYHVKYLGEFTLKGYDNSSKGVIGYFNSMTLPAGGSTGFTPGLTSSLLVRRLVK